MLDAVLADEIVVTEYGISARSGSLIYRVECAHRDAERLAAERAVSRNISTDNDRSENAIPVIMEVADETIILVGFSSTERRKLYRALRAVSGIGRRSALWVLDCGEVIDTLRAVAGKDQTYFQPVPGLGKARVGAIIMELEKRYKESIPKPLPLAVPIWVEARDAIMHSNPDILAAERQLLEAIKKAASPPRSAEELLALIDS
jgi:hypothetical protein